MARLTRLEMETVIIYNDAEDTAMVSTTSPTTKRKMAKLMALDDQIKLVEADAVTSIYELPKKQVKLRRKIKKVCNENATDNE